MQQRRWQGNGGWRRWQVQLSCSNVLAAAAVPAAVTGDTAAVPSAVPVPAAVAAAAAAA
eukprot:CAMPEP_0173291220 /NCGR_PEP_ID=MMETSP1143-20121109/12034_1 /TAXON_ID=483371 /ORGANISM="non described non described, Strain CCMP2298" /LENGTH=58 /DNA_ID=CAMNT_0014230437 /DNA_START=159 /DNA_END=331 /DNA_ORIENTATION=-